MSHELLLSVARSFESGSDLSINDAEPFLDALISTNDEPAIAGVLSAWNKKGIAEDEIYAIAGVLRSRMKRVNARYETFADIVGTGGSRAKTFNVSTAASFLTASAGMPVAKHGNKAATSNSGSADVLAELGIDPAVDPETAERCLNEIGICFMFAPNYHRLSPTLGKVRRSLGFPTIFNCVGPLCNPASAPHQLIGVWDKALIAPMANALARLGTKRSWVVYGEGGLDEISLNGKTAVAEVREGTVEMFEIDPEYFGIEPTAVGDLRTNDSAHSASMIRNVLLGEPHQRSAEDLVLINAAAAFHLCTGEDPKDIAKLLREELANGDAHRKLEELAKAIPA